MIIIGFYFDNNGGWIDHSQNGIISRTTFNSGDEIKQFIKDNNLPLTYKGCIDC